MKFRDFMIYLIFLVCCMLNVGADFKDYKKLENKDVPLIKREDLPSEFSDGAYATIADFIQKTRGLDFECALFFDYITGEILKCGIGVEDSVGIDFEEGEFEGYNVASIHNHPENILSPPSGKNFGILTRDFEDYELIAGFESFWVLKAKGLHNDLVEEMNDASNNAFLFSLVFCTLRYVDEEIVGKMHDIRYGGEFSKYINDKNISDIQLTKLEYDSMVTNSKTATYWSRMRITNPEVIKFARELENNPYVPSAKDLMYAFYQSIGMDVDYDRIFED